MKKTYLTIAILIIIILAALSIFLNIKMLQYKKLIDYYFPVAGEMFSISGKITEIQANVLSIETTIQDFHTVPEEWETKIVKITVADETRIIKFDVETGEQTEVNLSIFKVGNQISANAEENIKDKTEFIATSIELYLMPEIE